LGPLYNRAEVIFFGAVVQHGPLFYKAVVLQGRCPIGCRCTIGPLSHKAVVLQGRCPVGCRCTIGPLSHKAVVMQGRCIANGPLSHKAVVLQGRCPVAVVFKPLSDIGRCLI
jgi:hypothetical protein